MSESKYQFYGVNNSTPLSLAHNTDQWGNSIIGTLNSQTNGEIYIREIPEESRSAEYGWRIVNATFSQEDSLMTYFQGYGPKGEFLPEATFGINYTTVPYTIDISEFKYEPEFGNRYYVPVQNNFATPNTGGYTVQILDLNYPSEGLSFGMFKQGQQHQNLIISFRLFKLGEGYPNDLDLEVR